MTGLGHAKPQGQNRTIQASRDSSYKGQRCHYAIIWSLSPGMSLQPDVQASDPHGAPRLQWHGGFEQLSVKGKGSLPARSRHETLEWPPDRDTMLGPYIFCLLGKQEKPLVIQLFVLFLCQKVVQWEKQQLLPSPTPWPLFLLAKHEKSPGWQGLCAMALLACILSI